MKFIKKLFTGAKNVFTDVVSESWTLVGMFVAWLVLEGSAKTITGYVILATFALWIMTFRLRNPKE